MPKASNVLSGEPEISPRPSSSNGVIGLTRATPCSHPCSSPSGTYTGSAVQTGGSVAGFPN